MGRHPQDMEQEGQSADAYSHFRYYDLYAGSTWANFSEWCVCADTVPRLIWASFESTL